MTQPVPLGLGPSEAQIIGLLLRGGPLSRGELANAIGIDPSTISRAIPELLRRGWVEETIERRGNRTRGRPSKHLALRGRHHIAVGVKIGPDLLTGMAVDLDAEPLAIGRRATSTSDPASTLANTSRMVHELVAVARDSLDDREGGVIAVGLGVGGPVEGGRFCRTSHILGWENVDLTSPVAEATGYPVVASNDVNTLAAAHHWHGLGRSVEDLAVVTVGRGIGCGLILRGRLHVGHSGSAGELGHIPVVPDGPACSCGNRGCLESVASDVALLRVVRSAPGYADVTDIDAVLALARQGDEVARAAFAEAGAALGRGIAALNNLFNPELVILAGEGISAIEFIEPAMRQSAAASAFARSWTDCRLVIDHSGSDLWARGAAFLAIRSAVRRHDLLTRIRPMGRR